ncbi:MAG: DUF2194 domain-containing protein [Lachnospiraceae bacterium]|nr:DUF2194 domain-containing protein [Lachnospiraceae bacterium]
MKFDRIKKKLNKVKKESHINLTGMYVIGILYIILMVVLVAVQANVRYTIRDDRIKLLSKEELVNLKKVSQQQNKVVPKTLLVVEDGDVASQKAKNLFVPVFEQMKEEYDVLDVTELNSRMFENYDKIVLAISHYPMLAETIADIKEWVRTGGNLMVAYPPEVSGSFQSLYDILGIKDSGDTTMVEGLHFNNDFMIGGTLKDYFIIDAYDCALGLSLKDDCDIYIQSTEEYPVPLVWRRDFGDGSIVVDNFGILEKAYRGIHCSAYSLLGDYCVYPVINAEAFYIDDFPSPVPGGDGTYVTRDYNMSISDFYSRIWWNDIHDLAQKYGLYYTGVIIEDYSNQVSGEFKRNEEISRFQYFGNMLLRLGGEIGIHGYNHMPLVLDNFDYKDQYDAYVQWPSVLDMRNALEEVIDFTQELYKEEELLVYVPPSNVLSGEGRKLLNETSIRSVAAVYLSTDMAYEQEFEITPEDGMINVPRITSGCIIDEYMELAALSELNFHFVNTHFLHPDDVLDEDRGAKLGWARLYGNLCDYFEWLNTACPWLRKMTGTEIAAAVQFYDLIGVDRSIKDNELFIHLDNLIDESWMLLRLNKGQKIDAIKGGSYTEVADGLYLLECNKDEVVVRFAIQE